MVAGWLVFCRRCCGCNGACAAAVVPIAEMRVAVESEERERKTVCWREDCFREVWF